MVTLAMPVVRRAATRRWAAADDGSIDDAAIAAARRDDRAAQARLLRGLQDPLYRLCLGLLGTYAVLRGDQTFDPESSELLTELPLVAYLLWLLARANRIGSTG